jgi:hypothetical protein
MPQFSDMGLNVTNLVLQISKTVKSALLEYVKKSSSTLLEYVKKSSSTLLEYVKKSSSTLLDSMYSSRSFAKQMNKDVKIIKRNISEKNVKSQLKLAHLL